MWQSVIRVLLMITLGYGLFRAVPAVTPVVKKAVDNSNFQSGSVLGETADYVNSLLGNDTGNDEESNDIGGDLGTVVDELVTKTKDTVSEKVQEDVDKVKEGVKEAANEQFCKSVLKTLEEECGKFYCSE